MTAKQKRAGGRPIVRWFPEIIREKKTEILACMAAGICMSEPQIAAHHMIPRRTFNNWRRADVEFNMKYARYRSGMEVPAIPTEAPSFTDFRQRYFGHETFAHQQEWFKAVDSHDLSLILVPPEHAKTFTMSIEYPVYRIAADKEVRILIVSKSQAYARKILMAVKKRLSDHNFYMREGRPSVVRDFGPFEPTVAEKGRLPWTADLFYVTGNDSGEKDPTMEALGVGGQIYGSRADLIICDDIATLRNQQSEVEREKMLDWLNQEVLTRLSENGKLIIVGTRVHENDIYSTLLSQDVEWASDFAPIVQPAIIDETRQQVLWPEYWSFSKLVEKRRNRMTTRQWNLVYQQSAAGGLDNPFRLEDLEACTDEQFHVGQAVPGVPIVIGVDPALEGTLAIVVVAIDRSTGERWLVDCIARDKVRHPEVVKSMIVDVAYRYRATRCRIEKNAMQGFLSKDADLRRRLTAAGCSMEEEYTTAKTKYDPEWGVGSVAAQMEAGLWHIPGGAGSDTKIRPLKEELAAWRPGAKVKQDRVMALWLAELSARGFATYRPGLPTHSDVPKWVRKMRAPRWVYGRNV